MQQSLERMRALKTHMATLAFFGCYKHASTTLRRWSRTAHLAEHVLHPMNSSLRGNFFYSDTSLVLPLPRRTKIYIGVGFDRLTSKTFSSSRGLGARNELKILLLVDDSIFSPPERKDRPLTWLL